MEKLNKEITKVQDEFLQNATKYTSDNHIEIQACNDTLGNVMRWMAAFDEDEYENKITKENYRSYHADENMNLSIRYEHSLISGSGILTYFGSYNGRLECKHGYNAQGKPVAYPISTPFIDIVCDYANNHWEDEVRVISYYSGCQGLLAITVFDKNTKQALFSFGSLEHYGEYRAI